MSLLPDELEGGRILLAPPAPVSVQFNEGPVEHGPVDLLEHRDLLVEQLVPGDVGSCSRPRQLRQINTAVIVYNAGERIERPPGDQCDTALSEPRIGER